MESLWVYTSRQGYVELYREFETARKMQDEDNGCDLEQHAEDGRDFGGSKKSGHFWIDDGGDIRLTEVQ